MKALEPTGTATLTVTYTDGSEDVTTIRRTTYNATMQSAAKLMTTTDIVNVDVDFAPIMAPVRSMA